MKVNIPLKFKLKLNFTEEEIQIMRKLIIHRINQEKELKEIIEQEKNRWGISSIEYNRFYIQFEFNTVSNVAKVNNVNTEEKYALIKEVFKVQEIKEEKRE